MRMNLTYLAVTELKLNNPLLHRYWFDVRVGLGFGVTAYSIDDARTLLDEYLRRWRGTCEVEVIDIVEDVDVRDLDQGHVIPNMGPPNLRGVWFPNNVM